MDLDELIFTKVSQYLKKRNKKTKAPQAVELNDIRSRLMIVARALTGLPIEIFAAEREGGYKNNNFFLPPAFSVFDTTDQNNSFYFYRIIYLSIQHKLGFNWNTGEEKSLQQSQQKAVETAPIVLEELAKEYPVAYEWHQSFLEKLQNHAIEAKTTANLSWLYGKWMQNDMTTDKDSALEHFSDKVKTANPTNPVTTLKAKAVEEIRSIEVDKKQQEDYVLTHNFEKVETADEFSGVWRDFDGDDELEKHEDALQELNMKYTVRVDDTAHSVYQTEFIENATVSESSSATDDRYYITYPEWNYSKRRYRENFCRVFPRTATQTDSAYYHRTLKAHHTTMMGLRKMLTSLNNKLSLQRRQTDGHEFDLDAITDLFTDVHSGHTPSEKIYLSNRKLEKDLSILLILDSSLSSDSYVAGNRVLDVEKEVSILFGEILNEFKIDFSVASFFSKTRNFLHYDILKGFDENWSTARYKIGAAEPSGYTRIGAALRHAGNELQKQHSKNKWIILLSDGKPNDYDKYEGRYGVNDVKQALRELNQAQINSFAFAIEAQARYYLPQMFGQNHYRILSTPHELLEAMVSLFEKIRYKS